MYEKNEFGQELGFRVEGKLPTKYPEKINLLGHYCILEPLDIEKHAINLFEALSYQNIGDSWTYLPYGPFINFDEFKDWLVQTKLEKDTILFAILNSKTYLPVGIAGYLRINSEHGVIEVGHLHFSKLLQKTPAATEAMYLMMNYVFDELKYRRYEWKCNALNSASRNAALRLGFKFEGIFRQSNVFKNRNRDTAWFSILDTEWPDIKAKFLKWLSPNNFDNKGNQKISLKAI